MRQRTVERSTPVEAVKLHARPLAQLILKPRAQVMCIARQRHVQHHRQIGLDRTRSHHCAAQVELLPYRSHQVYVARRPALMQPLRNAHQRRACAAVVHRRTGHARALKLLEGRLVDHRATHLNAEFPDLIVTGSSDIDEQIGHQVHLVFLFRGRGVVSLGAEYAGMPFAILRTNQQLQAGQNFFRNAAQAVHLNVAIRLDAAHDETQLVHVTEDHHARMGGAGGPLDFGDHVANVVNCNFLRKGAQIFNQLVGHLVFIAAGGWRQHKLLQGIEHVHEKSLLYSLACVSKARMAISMPAGSVATASASSVSQG